VDLAGGWIGVPEGTTVEDAVGAGVVIAAGSTTGSAWLVGEPALPGAGADPLVVGADAASAVPKNSEPIPDATAEAPDFKAPQRPPSFGFAGPTAAAIVAGEGGTGPDGSLIVGVAGFGGLGGAGEPPPPLAGAGPTLVVVLGGVGAVILGAEATTGLVLPWAVGPLGVASPIFCSCTARVASCGARTDPAEPVGIDCPPEAAPGPPMVVGGMAYDGEVIAPDGTGGVPPVPLIVDWSIPVKDCIF